MKGCPSCRSTYPDEAPDFCPNDGMRLVREESAAFDPEKTMLAARAGGGEPSREMPPPPEPVHTPASQPAPRAEPAAEPPALQPTPSPPQQSSPTPHQWQQPPGYQSPQPGWNNQTPIQPQPAAQGWRAPAQPQQQGPQFGAQYPQIAGRRRAIAIAALVFGVNAASLMLLRVVGAREFLNVFMLVVSILGVVLGVTALLLALRKSPRFAGVDLAIAGLALGVAGLVYTLLNW